MKYVVFFVTRYASLDGAKAEAPGDIAAHPARTKDFHARGMLLMVGAFLDHPEEPLSTVAVLTTREAAEEYARGDHPFLLRGMVSSWRIREWADMLA